MLHRLTLLGLACFGVLPIALDPDAFWHLRLGRDLLAGRGAIVGAEPLSPLSAGPFVDHSWLHGVLLAIGERWAGPLGMSLVAWLPYLLIVGAMEALLRRLLPTWRWYDRALVITVLLVAARPVSLPRAGTYDVAFGLLVLLLVCFPSRRRLMALPLLAAAWAMLHGAGLLLGGAIAVVGLVVALRRATAVREMSVAIIAAVAAVCLLPGGAASALYPFTVVASSAQRDYIAEWQSPFYLADVAFLPAALLAGGLALGLARGGWRVLSLEAWLIGLPLFGAAALSTRWLLVALLIGGLLLLPAAVHGYRRRGRAPLTPPLERTVGGAVAAVVLLIAATRLLGLVGGEAVIAERYPVRGAAAAATVDHCGPLLAPYDWGGYLIAHGSSAVALYGDAGALEAGGVDLRAWFEAEAGLRPVRPLLDAADIDTVLAADGSPIDRELHGAGFRELQRISSESVLYLRSASSCQP